MSDPAPDHESIARLREEFDNQLRGATVAGNLQAIRDRWMGRKDGVVTRLLKEVATAPADERRERGAQANNFKRHVEQQLAEATEMVRAAQARVRSELNRIDVTLPGRVPRLGRRHPLTVVRDRMEAIFTRMGFGIVEGPEVEDEWHCFDALNMPSEHPARDMQDTLYLATPMPGELWRSEGARSDQDRGASVRTLLRTHTSAMQIRYMQSHEPPIRIVVPGRVYRRDNLDLTHTPMFSQMEGLVVGEGISLADLKGTLLAFAQDMFGATSRLRFRPSFFPYTEPSAEVDISCWACDGAGCPMCKRTGWLEILGCGMVHPAVFEAVAYDAEKLTGFAWGIGMERVAMLRYQVDDIRLFFENDLRFLEQFPDQHRAYTEMRLLVSWLRDFVDVKSSGEDIAEGLALRGFEVASVERLGDDAVIDFEITANRPDCLSVVGLAREVATLYDLPLALPSPVPGSKVAFEPVPLGESDRLRVTIEDADLCPRYAAAVADVSIGPSPAWLASRLSAVGIRPISSIVDITNYVLIELGHPMHAFDLSTLAGNEIRVRRAFHEETMTTLDGVRRTLEPDMLVIADAIRAQAVAGVMGGAASEVSAATRTVAFESVYFKPPSVRRTSKRLGLKTEASSRFERGADINAAVIALQRAITLMEQIGAGLLAGPIVDRYPQPRASTRLHLRRSRLALLLGTSVADPEVERILRGLGLTVTATDGGWDVIAPTFRVDLLREVDVIEEIGRHHGFDKLEPSFPAPAAPAPPPDPRIARDQLVRRTLTAAGLSEAITFGFLDIRAAEAFAPGDDVMALAGIANPLSGKFDTLRPSLLPGLIESVSHNRRHGTRDVRLFEIGARFAVNLGETRGVGLAWTGSGSGEHWSGGAREVDFFDVKGVTEQLINVLGVTAHFSAAKEAFLVPGQAARIIAASGPLAGTVLGVIGQIAPQIADARGLPPQDRVFAAELNLDALWYARVDRPDAATQLPRYPLVVRDLSIVVIDALPAEIIRDTIRSAGDGAPAPLTGITFFDRYQGKGIAEGAVSLSVRMAFQAPDRTLTDAEVQASVDMILDRLVHQHGAIQR